MGSNIKGFQYCYLIESSEELEANIIKNYLKEAALFIADSLLNNSISQGSCASEFFVIFYIESIYLFNFLNLTSNKIFLNSILYIPRILFENVGFDDNTFLKKYIFNSYISNFLMGTDLFRGKFDKSNRFKLYDVLCVKTNILTCVFEIY